MKKLEKFTENHDNFILSNEIKKNLTGGIGIALDDEEDTQRCSDWHTTCTNGCYDERERFSKDGIFRWEKVTHLSPYC
jgi:hypothetical protein